MKHPRARRRSRVTRERLLLAGLALFLADARKLQSLAKKKGRDKLRPHDRAVLEAYEAEYERKQGLRNQELIAFFDTSVHDSLAGFAKDATLPSDPRVIYLGEEMKSKHAMKPLPQRSWPATATV